ncbi:SMI1/KNR4 family protein [Exiguobacterium sp.]|uniref:SMI1/KNR4 family protein n=1 Tax=Exiguobacterium sp. TaxID=44751 RepID=UPI00263B9FF3|nr:SMI1/KNR4 family protein [Exiguobacterium sp.]MCC5892055.1 SMI1/KNR4 family protein [Exiguobacterium sp.]
MSKLISKFERVEKMIQKYPNAFTVGPGASETDIDEVEKSLGVTFPAMYRKFLLQYSYLITEDESIWGISPEENTYDIVSQTKEFNKELMRRFVPTLPSSLFGIQEGEFDLSMICMDTSARVENGIDRKISVYPPEPIGPEYLEDSFTEMFYEVCRSAVSTYSSKMSTTERPDVDARLSKPLSHSIPQDSYQQAKQLILEHPELSELGSGYTNQQVIAIENKLGVTFKGSYATFLKEFGGGLFGENIFFSLEDEELIEINRQLHHPTDYEYGLAENLIAVYYDDLEDFYACLDLDNEVNGEPSVVYRNTNVPEEDYDHDERLLSFEEFFLHIIKDTIAINE